MPEVNPRFRRGQRVRIPAGTPYTSTDPQYPDARVSKRSHTVHAALVKGPDVLVLGTISVRNTCDLSHEMMLRSASRKERAARVVGWDGQEPVDEFLMKVLREGALGLRTSPAILVTTLPSGPIQVAIQIEVERVSWAGSGGYWKTAEAARLEPA